MFCDGCQVFLKILNFLKLNLKARDVIHVAQVNRQWRDVTRQSTVFARIELRMTNSGMCYGWGFDYHGQLAKVGSNKPKLIGAFGPSVSLVFN